MRNLSEVLLELADALEGKSPRKLSFHKTAPEDRRPPKGWWENCIARAKKFADDPESFCGGLWYHPEDFAGGKKMKESFGEPRKSSGCRTCGRRQRGRFVSRSSEDRIVRRTKFGRADYYFYKG